METKITKNEEQEIPLEEMEEINYSCLGSVAANERIINTRDVRILNAMTENVIL